ncbi:MAG TPA: hypothetical protein ENN67_08825 [Firmicutes bacterium]|nr:hypothetical protein [Bacillota bacterium]
MYSKYEGRQVHVKLITGEVLPEEINFWGESDLAPGFLRFGIPKPNEVHSTEVEYHVPSSSIAYIRMEGVEV